MAYTRLHTRLQRLERTAHTSTAGRLHLWRLPDESEAMALTRYAVDPADSPHVHVHVWRVGRVSPRLATPPAPVWVPALSQPGPGYEERLYEALRQLEQQRQGAERRHRA